MKKVRTVADAGFDRKTVATVGTFDGVHLAHQEILRRIVDRAKKTGGRSLVLTFEPHPRTVVGPDPSSVRILTTLEEREALCEVADIDVCVAIHFDRAFSALTARDFYQKYLVEGTGVSCVFEGMDHHWGHNREGNMSQLRTLGEEFGFEVVSLDPVSVGGRVVNSSAIRKDLLDGNVAEAAKMLGRPYRLEGKVVEGDRRGRQLGFPTANIEPSDPSKLIPRDGIYVVRVLRGTTKHFGMMSIGARPTFHQDGRRTVEVNILDFRDDVYGETLQVDFLRRLRDERRYDSAEALIDQMKQDERLSRAIVDEVRKTGMVSQR